MSRNILSYLFAFIALNICLTYAFASYADSKTNKEKYFFENQNHSKNDHYTNVKKQSETDKFVYYEVKNSDTLMLISFELYTNYFKWRQIAKDNQDILKGKQELTKGMVLKIRKPLRPRSYPKGLPYLIKKDDTLGVISGNVYGARKYWRSIYLNNLDQIKDPNLIYAGFTLFYTSDPILAKSYLTQK